jgi:hypothetical protein
MAHALFGASKQAKASGVSRAPRKRFFDLFCTDREISVLRIQLWARMTNVFVVGGFGIQTGLAVAAGPKTTLYRDSGDTLGPYGRLTAWRFLSAAEFYSEISAYFVCNGFYRGTANREENVP